MIDENLYDDLDENPTLSSIAKIIGEESAVDISVDFGGVRLEIPQRPGQHSPLSVCIGLDSALKISQIYGGMRFDVPLMIGKRAEIIRLNEEGRSAPEIAREVRCSTRTVHRIRAAIIEEQLQIKLPF